MQYTCNARLHKADQAFACKMKAPRLAVPANLAGNCKPSYSSVPAGACYA